MKKLLLIALVAAGCANAQTDTGITLPAGHILHIGGSSLSYGYIKYVDTIPDMYNESTPLTLRSAKGGGDGSINNPDTTLLYNHFGYMRECVDKEREYWRKASDAAYSKYAKTKDYKYFEQHVTAVKRIEYWDGVRSGIQFVMYQRYDDPHFDYEFKTKPTFWKFPEIGLDSFIRRHTTPTH